MSSSSDSKEAQILGIYHTHPYSKLEGGYTGVSFSGADISYANFYREKIFVDAGTKQFMITPTQKTPKVSNNIKKEWNSKFNSLLKERKTM